MRAPILFLVWALVFPFESEPGDWIAKNLLAEPDNSPTQIGLKPFVLH